MERYLYHGFEFDGLTLFPPRPLQQNPPIIPKPAQRLAMAGNIPKRTDSGTPRSRGGGTPVVATGRRFSFSRPSGATTQWPRGQTPAEPVPANALLLVLINPELPLLRFWNLLEILMRRHPLPRLPLQIFSGGPSYGAAINGSIAYP